MIEAKRKILQKLTYICLSLSSNMLSPEPQGKEVNCGYLSTGRKNAIAFQEKKKPEKYFRNFIVITHNVKRGII